MSSMTLKSLVEKMNDAGRQALERAVGLCHQRSHHTIEIEHFLKALLANQDEDLQLIFKRYEISEDQLATQLDRALESFKDWQRRHAEPVSPSRRSFTAVLARHVYRVWRTPHARSDPHFQFAQRASNGRIDPPVMPRSSISLILSDCCRIGRRFAKTLGAGQDAQPSTRARKEECLDQFTIDLTAQASGGRPRPGART